MQSRVLLMLFSYLGAPSDSLRSVPLMMHVHGFTPKLKSASCEGVRGSFVSLQGERELCLGVSLQVLRL